MSQRSPGTEGGTTPAFLEDLKDDPSETPPSGSDLERLIRWADQSTGPSIEPVGLGSSWARLSGEISELPMRYAPFCRRLSAQTSLSEDQLLTELARARDPRAWLRTPFRGVRFLALPKPRETKRESFLIFAEPAAVIPTHSHPGPEVALVLEGGYADDQGREFHAGDRDEAKAGETHSIRILPGGPCVTAISLEERFVFEDRLAQAALRIFWKRPRSLD